MGWMMMVTVLAAVWNVVCAVLLTHYLRRARKAQRQVEGPPTGRWRGE